jgi:hypothetical protein
MSIAFLPCRNLSLIGRADDVLRDNLKPTGMQPMKMSPLSMSITDWSQITLSEYPSEKGGARLRTCTFGDIRVRMVDRRESLYYSILIKSCYGRIWEIPEDAFWISSNILAMRKDSKVDIAHTHFRRHSIVVTRGLQRQPHDEPDNPQNENRHGCSCVGILVGLDFFERRN